MFICAGSICCLPAFAQAPQEVAQPIHQVLAGSVEKTDDALGGQINNMSEDAVKNSDVAQETDKLIAKFRAPKHKAAVAITEGIYSVVPYRGFGPSTDAADIVLERVKKIKNLAGAEYVKQRIADRIHTEVVQATLEIAMGLDEPDADKRQHMLDIGYNKLKDLLGEDGAKSSLTKITAWSKQLEIPQSAYQAPVWDVNDFQSKVHACMAVSMQTDPNMQDIVKKVKKFHRSKAAIVMSGALESALEVASIGAPGFVGPIATEVAHAVFVASTGGSEPTKIINQMYYAKSVESRYKRLNDETQMALMNHQTAIRTKSPTLMACSEAILSQLIGADRISEVLGQTVLANGASPRELPIQTAEKPLDVHSTK